MDNIVLKSLLCVLFATAFCSCGLKDPVLYPNGKYKRIGGANAEAIVAKCEEKARMAGIKKDRRAETALKRGAIGAVGGAAAGAAGTAIYGGKVGRGTAAGAVGGGIWSAFTTMFSAEEPNPVYKGYVNRCVRESGLEVLAWD